jgi:small subunit ribosomal protein S3
VEAVLVAKVVAEQMERRVSHRRAIKQAAMRAMQRGARGIRIKVAGRLGGSDMSRTDQERQGRVPLHTLRAFIDYGFAEAKTNYGVIGVKVWVFSGEAFEVEKKEEAPAATAGEAAA